MRKKQTALAQLLFERGIKQVDVAQGTGICDAQVNRLVNGRRVPTVDELRRLSRFLRVSQRRLKNEQ